MTNSPAVGALSILFAATADLPGNAYVGPRGPGGFKGHPVVGKPGRNGSDEHMAPRPLGGRGPLDRVPTDRTANGLTTDDWFRWHCVIPLRSARIACSS